MCRFCSPSPLHLLPVLRACAEPQAGVSPPRRNPPGTWYSSTIHSSAAAYFIATIRSQFRMGRTCYRKQREEEKQREYQRECGRLRKEDRDKTRTTEEERNTATTHLSCTSLHSCVLLLLGVWASSACVLAAAVRINSIIPYLWDGPALVCCCSPFRFFLFCCCCYLLGLCSADGSLLLRGRICA